MLTDIEIAKQADIKPISDIAEKLGISADELEFYGKYKAKLPLSLLKKYENKEDGKLILVTAINPTPAGEGKTTVTVGLGEAMNRIGKKAVIALREPSMGPVFGIKGGAAGGGYAQVIPMEDINLHFTGDMHAITAANNLLCAIIDNHIQQGNELRIDPRRILFKRCLDMNDNGGKRDYGYTLPLFRNQRFKRAPRLNTHRIHIRRYSRIRKGFECSRFNGGSLKRRNKAESCTNTRKHSSFNARRTVCQHSARL